MAEISLKIMDANEKGKVEKVYTVDGYDLMMGTVEDLMEIIDLDQIKTNTDIVKTVIRCYGQLKPLLKDIFPSLTDEELKRVKMTDLADTILDLGMSIMESFKELGNRKRGQAR